MSALWRINCPAYNDSNNMFGIGHKIATKVDEGQTSINILMACCITGSGSCDCSVLYGLKDLLVEASNLTKNINSLIQGMYEDCEDPEPVIVAMLADFKRLLHLYQWHNMNVFNPLLKVNSLLIDT